MSKVFSIRVRQNGMRGPGKAVYTVATREDADKSLIHLNGHKDGNTYFVTEIEADPILTFEQVVERDKAERLYRQTLENFKNGVGSSPVSLVQTPAPTPVTVS